MTVELNATALGKVDVLWASGFGLGFLRPAPGTWGSLGALVVWWFGFTGLSLFAQFFICVVYFSISWWASERVCRRYDVDDAPQIVADEVVGMWISLLLVPHLWWCGLLGFVLFRVLDITKLGPIGWLDRNIKGGLGVMLDDVLAGFTVAIVLYLTVWLVHSL